MPPNGERVFRSAEMFDTMSRHLGLQEKERVAEAIAQRLSVDPTNAEIKFLDGVWAALADLTSDAHHLDSVGDRKPQRLTRPYS